MSPRWRQRRLQLCLPYKDWQSDSSPQTRTAPRQLWSPLKKLQQYNRMTTTKILENKHTKKEGRQLHFVCIILFPSSQCLVPRENSHTGKEFPSLKEGEQSASPAAQHEGPASISPHPDWQSSDRDNLEQKRKREPVSSSHRAAMTVVSSDLLLRQTQQFSPLQNQWPA